MENYRYAKKRMKAPPNHPEHCSDCGSVMQQLTGVFWFSEADDFKWKISLPFCPSCEPLLLQRCSETVH